MELEEEIVRNLKDAGCDDRFIESFLSCYREGTRKEQLCELGKHRKCILDKLYETHREIDCLDYLMDRIEREGE